MMVVAGVFIFLPHESGVPTSLQLRKLPGAWWRYAPMTLVLTCMGKLSSWPESDTESLNTHPGGNLKNQVQLDMHNQLMQKRIHTFGLYIT